MKTLSETQAAINKLDLGPIKFKLMEEKGWSHEDTDQIEKIYKGFLFLNAKYPDKALVPSEAMDEMWHTHILDTQKYMEDCEDIFGFYLHHFPYFGMRGFEDENLLKQTYEETIKVFMDDLGIDIRNGSEIESDAATCHGKCGNSVRQSFEAATCHGKCGNSGLAKLVAATCHGKCGNSRPSLG